MCSTERSICWCHNVTEISRRVTEHAIVPSFIWCSWKQSSSAHALNPVRNYAPPLKPRDIRFSGIVRKEMCFLFGNIRRTFTMPFRLSEKGPKQNFTTSETLLTKRTLPLRRGVLRQCGLPPTVLAKSNLARLHWGQSFVIKRMELSFVFSAPPVIRCGGAWQESDVAGKIWQWLQPSYYQAAHICYCCAVSLTETSTILAAAKNIACSSNACHAHVHITTHVSEAKRRGRV